MEGLNFEEKNVINNIRNLFRLKKENITLQLKI